MFDIRSADIERLDAASLRILSEIGVRVDDERLRNQALQAGAQPGHEADWLRLPPELVRQLVGQAPETARYADCRGQLREVGPGTEPTFWTAAALNYITGSESRAIAAADLAEFARVADALPAVFAVVGTSISDVPPTARDVVGFRILAENTRKHLRPLLFTADGVAPIIEMAQILAGGRPLSQVPLVSFGYSCLSPLHWSQISIDLWRRSAGHRLPIMLNGEPIAGATSPVTLAGSIALSNAEILAGAALVQLLEPGRPVVHNLGFAHVTDMRSAACLSGSAECALMAYAGARLADFYRLPSASWMGTDSCLDDEQSAMEKMLTGFAHVAGGVNVIWGLGTLQSEKALSPVQLVMDNELACALGRWWRGIRIDDEAIALDVVRDVVFGKQEFLSHDHTLAHFREELSESRLLSRTRRESWLECGGKTLATRAAEKVRELAAGPPPQHLDEDQRRELRRIEQRFLKSQGL